MNEGQERDNFLKILVAVQEYGAKSQRAIIQHVLKTENLTFCEFLDKYAHELYHVSFKNKCCQCLESDKLPDVTYMHRDQYFKLFQKDQSLRLKKHNNMKFYLNCCNYANTSACLDNLDFPMTFIILLHCCKGFLWDCCLRAKQNTLQGFLNENKHDIFHMRANNKLCTLCVGSIPNSRGSIDKKDWDILFETSTSQDDPSFYSAKEGILVCALDSKLSYELLEAFSDVIKISKQLRTFRNIVAHHVSLRIDLQEFEQMWSEIETILLKLSSTYNGDAELKRELEILKSNGSCQYTFEALLANIKKEQVSLILTMNLNAKFFHFFNGNIPMPLVDECKVLVSFICIFQLHSSHTNIGIYCDKKT